MGNKRNNARKNKRQANNWRNIIKMRKSKSKRTTSESCTGNSEDTQGFHKHDNFHLIGTNTDAHSYKIGEDGQFKELNREPNDFDSVEIIEVDHYEDDRETNLEPNNFNFDEFIEVDYNEDDADKCEIEIEEIHHLESDLVFENDERSILNKSESISSIENLESKSNRDGSGHGVTDDHGLGGGNGNVENRQTYQELRDEFDFHDDTNTQCSDYIGLIQARAQISGRRIVDIGFLFEQVNEMYIHSENCMSRMLFEKETKLGLRSIFHFYCSSCGESQRIQTSYKNDEIMNINKAATLGITSIGSGFYHLEEFLSNMDIPCMSSSTFDTENKKIQQDWNILAKHHTLEALREEIKMANDRGDVDSAGNALICVICDGSWGKRSYGKGFSSLSGCAAIIGFHTKKVLYYDTKNKYCNICVKSYAKNCPPNDHPCNINYNGPSSGMETEIIVEGFKYCEGLGARFHKIISDGDSSAFKEITEAAIYQNPELVIEKIECVNHLFKNFHKKFLALTKDTKFDNSFRKMISINTGDEIGIGIRMASKHWRESNVSMLEKLQNLEKDCLNAPYHYFGNHDNCNNYFCKKVTTVESAATIDQLKSGGVFHEILNFCNIYFASNVVSLLQDWTNNAAEELNNVIAKYLGGKRINYSLAGSYSGRCSAAVVQYNTKGHAGSEFHKYNNIVPNNGCRKMENSRIAHYAKNEAARQLKPRKKATKDKTTKGYGDCQRPDLSDHAYEAAKKIQLEKLDTDRVNRDDVLRDTYGQKYNRKWVEIRKKLINCVYFGRIIRARGPKSYANILEEMLFTPAESSKNAQNCHQRLYENEALKMFSLVHRKLKLEQTGIFIDKELSFLAASPLRLYGRNSIVNVQCPVKAFRQTIDAAMEKKLLPFFKRERGEIVMNFRSQCYVELQGQLHVTGRRFAYLVVWLGSEFMIKKIAVDHSFWNTQMVNKLELFFNEAMIKELADSRIARKMEIRQYDARTKTFV